MKIPTETISTASRTDSIELNTLGLYNQIKSPGPDSGLRLSIQRQYYPLYQESFKTLRVNFVNPRVEVLTGFFQRMDFLDFHHYGNDRTYRIVTD